MHQERFIYIASCVFTRKYPELSQKIQAYLKERFQLHIIRCCVPQYKTAAFAKEMPAWYRSQWESIPAYQEFTAEDTMVSLCHNCAAIFAETKPAIRQQSLWEFLLADAAFPFPDYQQEKIFVQDCWRSRENKAEQKAVRQLLRRMNFQVVELEEPQEDFCGISLLRPAPVRNLKLAPRHFVAGAEGKFLPHTPEEQQAAMKEHCRQFGTQRVAAYCHYCTEGLELGGARVQHLAELLFAGSRG